ncbi:MAG: hypothetical protein HUK15_02125, partial [Bacteroidales bacterium]|nr:hypothetical protein [Bacteroidales bacterium]
YSRYGVGDVTANSEARTSAMGGVGYATPYMNDINFKNPANIGGIDTLTFIFNFGLNAGLRNYAITNPATSKTRCDAQLSQISAGFSFAKWWKTAVGVTPYSNVGYSIYSADSSYGVPKNFMYAGDGGINRIVWQNAFVPVKNLDLGIGVSYLFGKIYHSNAISFINDSTGMYVNGFNQKTFKVSDVTFDVGAKYSIPFGKEVLSIGAYYGYNRDMHTKQSSIVYNTLATAATTVIDTIYSDSDVKGTIGLPHTIGVGLCFTHDDKLTFSADFTLQDWSQSKFFGECDSLDNSISVALGCEYTPNKLTPRNIWQSSSYRVGLYYNNSYLKMNGSQFSIPDYGLGFGIGFAPRHAKTAFNLSFQIGQRGSLKRDLVKETYFTVGFNLNLVDRWFVKSRIN